MKNETSAVRRERMQAERVEEDKRAADAAATEAVRSRYAAAAEARQKAEVTQDRSALRDAIERHSLPVFRIWELHAKNRDAPPFHFTGVAHRMVVVAKSAEDARHIAARAAGDYGVAWLDDAQTDCAELKHRDEPGVIAQDLGA